ncbi:M4 family metallopeptidase [Clostridium oceanicum]|uniref:Neutral metalloproteinase n=1 Tax=Clostridium oceanicum TaxID=1543 RepID=A0ABP3USN4_9CLOT
MKSKKLLATVLSTVITLSTVSAVSAAPIGKESKKEPKTTTILWEKSKQNTEKSTTGIAKKKFNNSKEINKFFKENISNFGLKKGSLKNTKTSKDEKGNTNYHMTYEVEGIPVYYGNMVFTTKKDCTMSSINGRVDDTFETGNFKNKIKLSKNAAIEKAKSNIKDNKATSKKADLYLYSFKGKPYVVYLVNLNAKDGNWIVFVNAETGSIVNKFNNTPTLVNEKGKKKPVNIKEAQSNKKDSTSNNVIDIQGKTVKGKGKTSLDGVVDIDLTYKDGKYYLKNSNKNIFLYDINHKRGADEIDSENGVTKEEVLKDSTLVSDKDSNFTDEKQVNAIDAYVNLSKTYDYYKNVLKRDSIDDNGLNVEGFVHVGTKYNNAFWEPEHKAMFFGDGDGKRFYPFARSLDVVAHELSHGVTSSESDLYYHNESGALNEAFSDIMGTAVEGKNFQVGEDCYTPGIDGDALRDMKDPSKGNQPAHMKDYYNVPDLEMFDNGGVHTNSGIINHAAYLIADGIEQLGRKDSKSVMGKLFYMANCDLWGKETNFAETRNSLVTVAKNLYGENSRYVKIVEKAFDEVGIHATPQLPL